MWDRIRRSDGENYFERTRDAVGYVLWEEAIYYHANFEDGMWTDYAVFLSRWQICQWQPGADFILEVSVENNISICAKKVVCNFSRVSTRGGQVHYLNPEWKEKKKLRTGRAQLRESSRFSSHVRKVSEKKAYIYAGWNWKYSKSDWSGTIFLLHW